MRSSILLALLCCTTGAIAQVSLHPERATEEVEGVELEHVRFMDGDIAVFYDPPSEWRYVAENSRKLLLRPDVGFRGFVTVESEQGWSVMPDDEALVALAVRGLPRGATLVSDKATVDHGFRLSVATGREVRFDYRYADTVYRQTVLFVGYQHCLLRFRVVAPVKDFESIHKQFVGSLCSWYWEDDGHLKPAISGKA